MEKINDRKRLEEYIFKYDINKIFTKDMTGYMELFFFKKNEHICRTDETIEYLYLFVEGRAKVYNFLSNGKSLLLCFYKPFMAIGDIEVIKYEKAHSNVQTIDDSYCIAIAFKHIRKYLLKDHEFLKFICDSLGYKLNKLSKDSSINILYPLENRLASYILAIVSHKVDENKDITYFEGNLTEIAELLGTSYRHLLRTLNNLCTKEIIKKKNNFYEVINIELLEELAGDLYEF
ncbi:cyclic nucleotide-binding domain-containing protein [Clostridium sp.]|uniref:cyclic nucleotide-binding domain-containing protein n=1 Tax=Clostridium sp. TaxID=1506 RepID=UPI0034640D9D